MEQKHIEKVLSIAEKNDWSLEINKIEEAIGFTFSRFSPSGQDFSTHVNANTLRELCDELKSNHEYFDVSSEAYLWLGDDGHGKNGAPYEMIDVYTDMQDCEKMLECLLGEIRTLLQS